ncbi:MAG: phospho-N-acetylmuramoyl-pentapeptide-transferase [Kiritimatiellia bacterium]|nr:phospho-N-acetylmuramoyl-pentapeptide-transferase [Kiritimatiellia bacterium]
MLYYLHLLSDYVSYLRVFQYISVRVVAAAGTAFVVSILFSPFFIRRLTNICCGDETRYRSDLPALDSIHGEAKKKTPTMGGLLIVGAILFSSLLWAVPTNPLVLLTLATMCYMGLVGFTDDYIKIVKRDPHGLRTGQKLILQSCWVVLLFLILITVPATSQYVDQLMVPMLKTPLITGVPIFVAVLFVMLVIIGASNAVNLTDGMDGLAIGCTCTVAFAFAVMSYVAGHVNFANYLQIPHIAGGGELAVFCGAVLGAGLGFLWFNCHPAQIFMGDTGSLALGGALGCVAVLIKHELALVIVGGVFVIEALSVILQVGWFRLKGKRIFACAPLHHHFELKKTPWSETQIMVRFWIVSAIFALLGILLLKIR